MVIKKVHSGKDSNHVPVSRQKSSKLPGTVDGSDGSLISESSSSSDSSSSVDSHKRKQPRGQHGQRRKADMFKTAEKKPHALDEKQTKGRNSDLLSDQASATNDNIKSEIQDADVVMIRAENVRLKEKIKFRLFWPYKLDEFKQEVAKRLPLEGDEGQKLRRDYTINYEDGDKGLIPISCDDDLQLHVKTSRVLHKKCVEVLLI